MTKTAKSPFSIKCDLFYILFHHFFFVGGHIVSVEELLVGIVPITKRFIRGTQNLPVNSLNLIRRYLQCPRIILWSCEAGKIRCMSTVKIELKGKRYRFRVLQASHAISPGIMSLSNSGLDFKAFINHGFHALLDIAESVIPVTCLSKLLNA